MEVVGRECCGSPPEIAFAEMGLADDPDGGARAVQGAWTVTERIVRWDIHPEDLVTHRFSLDQVDEAYSLMASGKCGKVAVCFDEELEKKSSGENLHADGQCCSSC